MHFYALSSEFTRYLEGKPEGAAIGNSASSLVPGRTDCRIGAGGSRRIAPGATAQMRQFWASSALGYCAQADSLWEALRVERPAVDSVQ